MFPYSDKNVGVACLFFNSFFFNIAATRPILLRGACVAKSSMQLPWLKAA